MNFSTVSSRADAFSMAIFICSDENNWNNDYQMIFHQIKTSKEWMVGWLVWRRKWTSLALSSRSEMVVFFTAASFKNLNPSTSFPVTVLASRICFCEKLATANLLIGGGFGRFGGFGAFKIPFLVSVFGFLIVRSFIFPDSSSNCNILFLEPEISLL